MQVPRMQVPTTARASGRQRVAQGESASPGKRKRHRRQPAPAGDSASPGARVREPWEKKAPTDASPRQQATALAQGRASASSGQESGPPTTARASGRQRVAEGESTSPGKESAHRRKPAPAGDSV